MNQLARLFAALPLFTACHFADVDRLQEHMTDCGVAAAGPICEEQRELASRRAFERFVSRDVTDAEIERCLLDVDCSDERMAADAAGAFDEVDVCVNGPGERVALQPASEACLAGCGEALAACGDGEPDCADSWAMEACFDDHETCIFACPIDIIDD